MAGDAAVYPPAGQRFSNEDVSSSASYLNPILRRSLIVSQPPSQALVYINKGSDDDHLNYDNAFNDDSITHNLLSISK